MCQREYPEVKAKFPDKLKQKNFDADVPFWDSGSLLKSLTKHRSDIRTISTLYATTRNSGIRAKPRPLKKLGVFDVGGDPDQGLVDAVTGADLSADGQYLSVLTYHAIFIFRVKKFSPPLTA